jgi:hypothetical protein
MTETRSKAGLTSRKGERLDVKVVLTMDFVQKDGGAFVRYLKDQNESRIESGINVNSKDPCGPAAVGGRVFG